MIDTQVIGELLDILNQSKGYYDLRYRLLSWIKMKQEEKMKTIIKGDLILTKDTTFETSIKVEGNIKGWFNLKVAGNIDAWDIDAWNINAWDINTRDINAMDINAGDINAWNINARDINAWDIICEKRIKKSETNKTIARVFIQDKSNLERKEQLKQEIEK